MEESPHFVKQQWKPRRTSNGRKWIPNTKLLRWPRISTSKAFFSNPHTSNSSCSYNFVSEISIIKEHLANLLKSKII